MIDPAQLDELLEVLREHGASNFSCPEFSVSLLPSVPESEADVLKALEEAKKAAKEPLARGVYGHPSLWPNGKPASFPGSETKS